MPKLLLFDGNAALADVDLDAGRLVPFLVEQIAEDHSGDSERADDEVENVTIHSVVTPFRYRARTFENQSKLARHTSVKKRPALPSFKFLIARLLPAVDPFCLVLGPLLLCRLPLLSCPGLHSRRRGGL